MPARTEFHFLQGKASWSKLDVPDLQYKYWSVTLYMTPQSRDIFNKLKEKRNDVDGILNTIKTDQNGDEYVVLRRPVEKRLRDGTLRAFTPPEVIDKDGKTLRGVPIGNGSDLTCKIIRYTYKKPMGGWGSAIRLESVRVDNLVTFDRKSVASFDIKEYDKAVEGLAEQPQFF